MGRQGRRVSRGQTMKGSGRRNNGNRHTTYVGKRRRGFLKGLVTPQPKAFTIVCGISRKRRREPSAGTSPKKPRISTHSTRPIIEMLLHQGNHQHRIRALLDTGCSIALISQRTLERLGLEQMPHPEPVRIENYTGEAVPGAGQYYTKPLRLQHRKHYMMESFEISPMDIDIDIFLPFLWVTEHPPLGAWTSEEVRFNSTRCLEQCTKYETKEFSLTWDESVNTEPSAQLIGYVTAIDENPDPLKQVPLEFHQYLRIMSKEAAHALPKHRPYDCKIDIKEGSPAPWGPIYPLSEIELQTLREWLKEMERTGKIKRSTSLAGSPILFVPKPSSQGLRLCVDYRGLNSITIQNRNPLPLMQELQDRVQGA